MPTSSRPFTSLLSLALAATALAPAHALPQAVPPDTGFGPPAGTANPPTTPQPAAPGTGAGGILSPGDPLPATGGTGGNVSFEAPAALDPSRASARTLGSIRGDQPLMASALLGNVKGQPVFVQDVLAPIDQPLRRLGQNARTLGEFRTDARKLIEGQIGSHIRDIFIFAAADRSLTEAQRAAIDAFINKKAMELRTEHGGSVPATDRALRAKGSSYEKELADLRRRAVVDFYRVKTISPRIVVTYEMIRAAYERDPKAWQEDAAVELFSLRLPVRRWLPRAQTTDGTAGRVLPNPSAADVTRAENEALATARKLAAELQSFPPEKRGAEFARLVEDYGAGDRADDTLSRGGRTAGLKRGTFTNEGLENYIFSQPANSLPAPYLVRENDPLNSIVYVLMIGEKKDARVIPFTEAERKINDQLREAQFVELWNEMARRLVNPAEIEAVLRSVDVAVDAAVARYATTR